MKSERDKRIDEEIAKAKAAAKLDVRPTERRVVLLDQLYYTGSVVPKLNANPTGSKSYRGSNRGFAADHANKRGTLD